MICGLSLLRCNKCSPKIAKEQQKYGQFWKEEWAGELKTPVPNQMC